MRKLVSDSAVYGLGSVANQSLSFVLLPLYTRFLTPGDYGVLAIVAAAGLLLAMAATLGVHSGLVRIYFLYDDARERGQVLFSALSVGLLLALVSALSLGSLAPLLAPRIFDFSEGELLYGLAVPLYTLVALKSVPLACLQVESRPRPYIACNFAGLATSLVLTVILVAFAGRGVRGCLEAQLVGAGTEVALATFACLGRLRPRLHLPAIRQMLAFSLPLLPMNLTAWGLGLADRYFLKHYAGVEEVGLYALGFKFGAVLNTFFVIPFSVAWFPYMFSMVEEAGHRRVFARTLEYFSILGCVILLGVATLGGPLIQRIADPAYLGAEDVIFWLGLGFLLRGMTRITVAGIHIQRKTHYSSLIYIAGALLSLLLLALLVPRYGMLGAAVAMLITYAVIAAGYLGVAQRLYPIPYRPLRVLAILAVATAVYQATLLVPGDTLWPGLAARLLILLAFPVLLWLLRLLEPEDLERARLAARGAFAGARGT